jgi:hypothetical protein
MCDWALQYIRSAVPHPSVMDLREFARFLLNAENTVNARSMRH